MLVVSPNAIYFVKERPDLWSDHTASTSFSDINKVLLSGAHTESARKAKEEAQALKK